MNDIQKGLLAAFEKSDITYDELAKRTNLPKSALYRYLNGDTEKIPIDRFQAVCEELHVDAGTLLGWKEQPPENRYSVLEPVTTCEARIISAGVDKMPEERRRQALAIMQAAFTEYADFFKEETDK